MNRRKEDIEAISNLINQLETERQTAERCIKMGLNHLRAQEAKLWGQAMLRSRKRAKALKVAINMIKSCTDIMGSFDKNGDVI